MKKILSIILILSTLTACGLTDLVDDYAIKQVDRRHDKLARHLYGRQDDNVQDGISDTLGIFIVGLIMCAGVWLYESGYIRAKKRTPPLTSPEVILFEHLMGGIKESEQRLQQIRQCDLTSNLCAAINQVAPLTPLPSAPITSPEPEPVVRLPDGHTLTVSEAEAAIAESINIRNELEAENRSLKDNQIVRLPNGTPCTIPVAETLIRGQANLLRQAREQMQRYSEECTQVFAVT